ncbi:MAG: AraC family transcriptional regulator [Bauldia sp.]
MDALSEIVRLLRPETVLLGEMAAAGRWGLRMPPQPGPVFYLVTEGRCWYVPDEGAPTELIEGDYMLSLRPASDTFVSEPGAEIVLTTEAYKRAHKVDGELRLGDPERLPTTRKLGGLILCNPANADLLLELLPRVVMVRAERDANARLRALLSLLKQEADGASPGREAILSRLIEVLLIETLRGEATAWSPNTGVLGGLADPQLAKALASIHADVGRGWTLAELARDAGMSRSVFARRFSEAVGAAPVEYLLRWRMALAKDALLHGRGTLDEIAATVGYKSASAFSTAFSHRVGCPPSEFAAMLRGREATTAAARATLEEAAAVPARRDPKVRRDALADIRKRRAPADRLARPPA